MADHESSLAVLVDFENMARPGAKGRGDFDIHLVLNRLADKGRVLVKRAYADWSRYRDARHDLQNAGLELIEMPSAREGAKNRADIKMAVDAMELAYSREHLDTFVIVSGDSDFTPLVGKLRELNKRVTGMGNRDSASELLIANCDEFIFYDSLASAARAGAAGRSLDPRDLLRQTLTALQREGVEWPLASVVKDSMRRKNPAFDENETGYSTFSKFLEDAQSRGTIRLQTDPRSGTYRVELADGTAPALPVAPVAEAPALEVPPTPVGDEERGEGGRRRRRRRRGEPAEGRADVFEFVVEAAAAAPLPDLPLDQPISYEDVILAGPDLGADLPDVLLEVSDVTADDAASADVAAETEAAGGRRRRRRGEPAEPVAVADAVADALPADAPGAVPAEGADAAEGLTAPLGGGQEPSAVPTADAPGTTGAEQPPVVEAGDEATTGRSRRRRRRTAAGAGEPGEQPAPLSADGPAEGAPDPDAQDDAQPAALSTQEPAEGAPEAADEEPEAQEEGAGAALSSDAPVEGAPEPEVQDATTAQAPDAPVEAAAEAAPAEGAARRGRVRRGTRRAGDESPAPEGAAAGREAPTGATAEPALPAEAPEAAEAAASGETPKPRRRRRAASAGDAAADASGGGSDAAVADGDEAPTPRRRRRTKAEIEAEKAATAGDATDGAGAEGDEAPKPRRRRRTTAEIEAEKAATGDGAGADGDEAPKPRRRRRTKAEIEAERATAEGGEGAGTE